jgi:hypothetical protein
MNLIFGTGHEKEQMLYYMRYYEIEDLFDIDKEDWGCDDLTLIFFFML